MKTTPLIITLRSLSLLAIGITLSTTATAHNVIYGHEYVDLGLPSGLLWATCNIGASNPEEYGDYLAWGETEAKSYYSWGTYTLGDGEDNANIHKYGEVDGIFELGSTDDVAHVRWGGNWCLPTSNQYSELSRYCTWKKIKKNGILAFEGTGPNGNKIVFPLAGAMNFGMCEHESSYGTYWINDINEKQNRSAGVTFFAACNSGPQIWYNSGLRYIGNSARAVCYPDGIKSKGKAGDNLSYTIYNDNTLVFSGFGDMDSNVSARYSSNDYLPIIDNAWRSIKSIIIPDGVTSIGYRAFLDCQDLNSIVLPSQLSTIGAFAFQNCSGLTSIYMRSYPPVCKTDYIHISPFDGIPSSCTLYVPVGLKSDYQNAPYWAEFQNIEEYYDVDDVGYFSKILFAPRTECRSDEQIILPVCLRSSNEITAFSFEMQLPSDFTVSTTDGIQFINDESATSHTVSASINENGLLKVAVFSVKNRTITCDDYSQILKIKLDRLLPNGTTGKYNLTIKNITLTLVGGSEITPPNFMSELIIEEGMLGDVNTDGEISISDAIGIINLWLGTDMDGLKPRYADVNRDDKVNVTDVVWIIDWVISGYFSPAPARKTAARDSNDRNISIESADLSIGTDSYIEVPIQISSNTRITALQGIISLPEGLRIEDITAQHTHQLVFEQQENGSISFVCISMNNALLDKDSPVLRLQIACDMNYHSGSIQLSEIAATSRNLENIEIKDASIRIDREPTSIVLPTEDNNDSPVYDLHGRIIRDNPWGISIKDRKIIF